MGCAAFAARCSVGTAAYNPPMALEDWIKGNINESAAPLSRETLNSALDALRKRGSERPHYCPHDGHVMQFNPFGFHFCIVCWKSEADIERPD